MPSSSPNPVTKLSFPMAMAELKTRILSSLSKLSDRDTHQIAAADLEDAIKTLTPTTPKALAILLGCLLQDSPFDSSSSPVLRRESLRLMSLLASTHTAAAAAHLPKMVAHVVRRLKDPGSDSSVRDACRDAAGVLAGLYVKGEDNGAAAVGVFVRPLMEAMGEQSRAVQAGAAACLARVVECGGKENVGGAAYGKICPRVCKMVGGQGALAKGAMLSVLASLSQYVIIVRLLFNLKLPISFALTKFQLNLNSITRFVKYPMTIMSVSTSEPSSMHSEALPQSQLTSRNYSYLSSHMAMAEYNERILSTLSKLSDRDTQQVAVAELEEMIQTLPLDGISMLLNSLLNDRTEPYPNASIFYRESLRLLTLVAYSHPKAAYARLPKIISHILRRIRDPNSDSLVRNACSDAIGSLAAHYLKSEEGHDGGGGVAVTPVAGLFIKPLLEVMGEESKTVQAGAALCLAKVVECVGGRGEGTVAAVAFHRLFPRICKMIDDQSFLAKGAMLSVVSRLSQVGAISPQNMPLVLQSIRECLENSDWATRKAAADTLSVIASHSSHLVTDGAASIIAALEACRFDKVKPARDSIMEALQLWKKLIGKGEEISENLKDGKKCESINPEEKVDNTKSNSGRRRSESVKDSSATSSPTSKDSISKEKDSNIPEQAVVILKKRMPSLTDKELNPEFFQKLETRSSVEVVVPRRCQQSSHSQGEEEPDMIDGDSVAPSKENENVGNESIDSHARTRAGNQNIEKRVGVYNKLQSYDDFTRDKWTEQRGFRAKDSKARVSDADDRAEQSQRDPFATRLNISRTDADGSFMNSKGNWLAIQRQLSQLERQQVNLMNMLQDFMGGSHDTMITLENRVRGLERVVEEMARDLSLSSGRRGSNAMLGFEGSPGRSSNKYNGLHDYPGPKFGRGVDSRMPFAERFLASDNILLGVRGRDSSWRPDSEAWDSYAYTSSRNGLTSSRRGLGGALVDCRSPRTTEHEGDQPGSRRARDKGQGPFRLGEGPSARSVWQASKDEATLEAIRVAGEDNGTSRIATRETIRELDTEALTDDNSGQERGPLWALWSRAMDSLHVGDVDSAYAEVVSSGDDMLLVKLMERSGPVADQLSNEVASEVLHAVSQLLLEQSLLDTALAWIQQFTELIVENGVDMGIPLEVKREVLFSLHEASAMEPPEDWEGAAPDQIMDQLALAWGINIQQLIK